MTPRLISTPRRRKARKTYYVKHIKEKTRKSLLCFCRNIAKGKSTTEKVFTVKKLDLFTKRTNINWRLIGHLDLWITKNLILKKRPDSQIRKYLIHGRLKKSEIKNLTGYL